MCKFKRAFQIFGGQVDVQKGPYGFGKILTIDVPISSTLPYFIQMMCVLAWIIMSYVLWMKNYSMTFSLESESGLYL